MKKKKLIGEERRGGRRACVCKLQERMAKERQGRCKSVLRVLLKSSFHRGYLYGDDTVSRDSEISSSRASLFST